MQLVPMIPGWLQPLALCALAVLLALALHFVIFLVLGRILRRVEWLSSAEAVRKLRGSTRWLLLALVGCCLRSRSPLSSLRWVSIPAPR
ncbi:hypothetical protein [Altererythrobacter sp. CC-YST694]|uniref:hypothetical protein n=1 Tax=Altererythrobacter sp. CC-YST694 TaxID=2755038 RepID=UPI001D02E0C0|nr:hypothetical protein [Altererythrobacter sp. CC-YST694]